jgi:hypothetical protein
VLPDVRVLSWPRNLGPGAEEGGFLNFYIRLVTVDDYSWASGVAGIGDVLLDETAAGLLGLREPRQASSVQDRSVRALGPTADPTLLELHLKARPTRRTRPGVQDTNPRLYCSIHDSRVLDDGPDEPVIEGGQQRPTEALLLLFYWLIRGTGTKHTAQEKPHTREGRAGLLEARGARRET